LPWVSKGGRTAIIGAEEALSGLVRSCPTHYSWQKDRMWEKALNHYCGDHSRCDHPAYQSYHWNKRDIPEAQINLRQHVLCMPFWRTLTRLGLQCDPRITIAPSPFTKSWCSLRNGTTNKTRKPGPLRNNCIDISSCAFCCEFSIGKNQNSSQVTKPFRRVTGSATRKRHSHGNPGELLKNGELGLGTPFPFIWSRKDRVDFP
jgi:hypothetical protein